MGEPSPLSAQVTLSLAALFREGETVIPTDFPRQHPAGPRESRAPGSTLWPS